MAALPSASHDKQQNQIRHARGVVALSLAFTLSFVFSVQQQPAHHSLLPAQLPAASKLSSVSRAAVQADTGTALPRPHTCLPYRATAHMSSMGCRQPTASAVGHAARAFRRCWWAQMGHRSGCAHAEVLNSPCCHPAPVELRSTLQVVTHRTTTVRGTCISPRTLNPHCNR